MKAETRGRDRSGSAAAVRRRPVQRRSLERYERLLDACAALLDEVGATALTTKDVAHRAGVPIGTLYQFFAGKESLLGALAERNLDRYLDRLNGRLTDRSPVTAGDFVDLAVDEFVAMKRTVLGFGHLDFGLVERGQPVRPEDEHLLDAEVDNNTAVVLRLQTVGGGLFGSPDATLRLRVAMECADAVLKLAFRKDPDGDPDLISECKLLLRRYLVDVAQTDVPQADVHHADVPQADAEPLR